MIPSPPIPARFKLVIKTLSACAGASSLGAHLLSAPPFKSVPMMGSIGRGGY